MKKSYLLLDEIAVFTELYKPRYLATLFNKVTKLNFLKLLELYTTFHTAQPMHSLIWRFFLVLMQVLKQKLNKYILNFCVFF